MDWMFVLVGQMTQHLLYEVIWCLVGFELGVKEFAEGVWS